MKDYYKLLNLKPSANLDEITTAYQKLDLQFNPAKNNGDTMFESTFKEVKEAYEVLSDPIKRKEYDKVMNYNQPTAEIILFEADVDSFEDGDTVKIQWKTENATKVEIDLFGRVDSSGTKIFKPRNSTGDLKLNLKAWYVESDKPTTGTLTLPFIQELDLGGPSPEKNSVAHNVKESRESEREQVQTKAVKNERDAEKMFSTVEEPVEHRSREESFFSVSGRIRRSTYLVRGILLGIPLLFLYAYIAETTYYYIEYDVVLVLSFLGVFAIGILSLIQFVKRLHDIGLSGWFVLITLIPYLGGLFGLVVMCIDSNRGTNKYGPDPKGRLQPGIQA